MKSILICCIPLIVTCIVHSQVYLPPSCIIYENGILTIYPPDSVPVYTGGLLGYNVYVDDEFVENLSAGSPEDTVTMTFDPLPMPGYRSFCANAVYQNWISDHTCDTAFVSYGHTMPFTEDWSSGSLETNIWSQEEDYWHIDGESGEPIPSVKFHPSSLITNYNAPLTSFSLIADTIPLEFVIVEFDVKLECNTTTGDEKLYIQYWDWSTQSWHNSNCGGFTNAGGSFDWKHIRCKYTALKSGPFMIRFAAIGENSSDISGWYIDNIQIYQDCGAVFDLTSAVNNYGHVVLEWELKTGCNGCYFCWIGFYHPGSYSNSIGTGSQAEFDVAHFWSPDLLTVYEGMYITAVRFYPAESQTTYTIRIWEGDSANLVYEQAVENPLISQWNLVYLDTFHPIDISQNLWIGYHVETQSGYPAGVDWGPAYDGYGNRMYFEGEWTTLKEISPDLDYNWLIEAYAYMEYPMYCSNNIYKKVGDGEYVLIDKIPSDEWYTTYVDDEVDLTETNCYKVTNFTSQFQDTCESEHYGESCELPVTIPDIEPEEDLLIYPNPVDELLNIISTSEILEIQIIDFTGRIIYEERNLKPVVTIHVRDFGQGIYLMRISLRDKMVYRKVIVN